MIYFVQQVDEPFGPIKIGYTWGNFAHRFSGLQRGSPVELVCLACIEGTVHDEWALHSRFAASRKYGEWFAATPELLAVIEEARKTPHEHLGFRHLPRVHFGNWHCASRGGHKRRAAREEP